MSSKLVVHPESHLDHVKAMPIMLLIWLLAAFKDKIGFFKERVTLPPEFAGLEDRLYGPANNDGPIPESDVIYVKRGNREWPSRCVRAGDKYKLRYSRDLTIIGGEHEGQQVIYTIYGGAEAMQEPGDPALIAKGPEAVEKAKAFWSQHALLID